MDLGLSVATRYGTMSCFDAEDLITCFLTRYGEWAYFEGLLARSLRPTRVFDIGAFIGTFSLAISEASPMFVLAVDANPVAYAKLKQNLSRNLSVSFATKCAAVSLRIGDVCGKPALAKNEGSYSLEFGAHVASSNASLACKLEGLRQQFGDYDLLKLDVEGSEREVIISDLAWIKANRPTIWAECNETIGSLDLYDLMRRCGYEVYYFRYPAFNPNNFNACREQLFPFAFEAGLLAVVPGTNISGPSEAISAGAALVRVDTREHLRQAMWLTPRWGRAEWWGTHEPEAAARLSRQETAQAYETFLIGGATARSKQEAGSGTIDLADAIKQTSEEMKLSHALTAFEVLSNVTGCTSGSCDVRIDDTTRPVCQVCGRRFGIDYRDDP